MKGNRLLLLLSLIRRRRQRRQDRSMYVRQLFLSRGSHTLIDMLRDDPTYHHKLYRMTVQSFDFILNLVKGDLYHSRNHRIPISPKTRLALTLRYLASGDSMVSIGVTFRVSPGAVRIIVRETLSSIIKRLGPEFFPPPTVNIWAAQEEIFSQVWNFPNACGAIDGKHVRLRCPKNTGSTNHNYKGFFSIVLLAISGGDYSVIAADIGACGSSSDSGILNKSFMGKALERGTIGLPAEKKLPGSNITAPHVLLGDEGFGLKPYLLRPFPGKSLDLTRSTFNYRLCRGRRVVENMFGILCARWRIYNVPIHCDMDLAKLIVEATIILHNYLNKSADHGRYTGDNFNEQGEVIEGGWREEIDNMQTGMVPIPLISSGNFSAQAGEVRDNFKDYFNSGIGSTYWQYNNVLRGGDVVQI